MTAINDPQLPPKQGYVEDEVDGVRVYRNAETGVLLSDEIPTEVESEIADLKAKLSDTDYEAIKYAEGITSAEEYAATKAQRQAWREQINALEETA
jgi:hypothetical protein